VAAAGLLFVGVCLLSLCSTALCLRREWPWLLLLGLLSNRYQFAVGNNLPALFVSTVSGRSLLHV
jgi:hypothetical protein